MFDKDLFEQTINDILPGLTMYVRDVNLDEKLAKKYVPDMIIMERGYTDASSRVGGMKTTHRFSILSNHLVDLSEYEHGTNWGLFIAQRSSHFLVLDVYKFEGKTQILLLHLPNDKRWKLFENVHVNILDDVIADSRKRFEAKFNQEVIEELATKEWLERCSAPLGMTNEGELFDLNINMQAHLSEIGQANFRRLFNEIVYIQTSDNFRKQMGKSMKPLIADDGFLAYGYIDDQAGFSFRFLCSANIRDNKLSCGEFEKETAYILRKGQLNDSFFLTMEYVEKDFSIFGEYIAQINEGYRSENPKTEEMRNFGFLDGVRDIDYPDDIQIILFKEGLQPEQVWAKCWDFTENKLYAKLLNEPNQDFGCHIGSIIGFNPTEHKDGLICVFNGEIKK